MAGLVCPWWLGYFHLGPIRRWSQNPEKILSPYVERGMRVLDVGCGMGFFTLEMAKIVGPGGLVAAIDLQKRMINALKKRASRAGLLERIDARVCESDSLGSDDLADSMDFAFAFYVVHEVPDIPAFFGEIRSLLIPERNLLVVEPKGHVTESEFDNTIAEAERAGFSVVERPEIRRSGAALFRKV